MSMELLWRPKLVVARYSGFVSEADFLGSIREIAKDPRFDDLQFVVGNFLATTGHLIGTQSAIEAWCVESAGAKHTNSNIRILIISDDETIRRVFNDMLRMGGETIYPIFFSPGLPEAAAWLRAQPILHEMPSALTRSIYF